MKKTTGIVFFLAAFLAASSLGLARGAAQNKPLTDQEKAMMDAMMKAAAVNENHALLKPLIGKWNAAVTTWESPTAAPQTSQGSSEAVSLYEGRFVMENFKSTMMNMPFQGMSVTGYDNVLKKFCVFWIDNSSTAFSFYSGSYDPIEKVFNYTSKWMSPRGGTWDVRMAVTIVSPDEHTQQMFMTMPGQKEYKSIEIRYTRVKKVSGGD
jgi:hypothetical protein